LREESSLIKIFYVYSQKLVTVPYEASMNEFIPPSEHHR